MIDRYLLRILLTVSIFCVGLTNSYSQVRDDANKAFRQKIDRELDAILKGARDPEVISSLNAFYCSDDGPADVFLDPTILPPGTTEIKWYVFVADASGDISISSVVEDIGSYPNNGLRFFPQRVPEEHRNKPIVLSYQFRIGIGFEGGSNDYTFVLKRPEAFNFAHNVEICHRESTSLTLSGSENGVPYFLYKDGVQYRPFPATGNGGTLVFTNITEAGVYTVTALNQFSPPASSNIYRCEATMTGSATVVVNPLPVPVTASDKSAYCEGETINLFGGPDAMVSYTWEYPDGTIVTERNPVIASSVRTNHNGSYTLTVEDANGCVGTTTLNIVVNERPQISPIADLEVCEDDAITVSPTVTGGAGPYTYLWEKGAITVATSATLSIPVATLADAGTYTLTVTDNNGCGSSSESFDVIVNPRPVIDNISNSGPVCVGAMVQLTVEVSGGNGIYSFAWNGPDGFSSTEQNPEIGPVTSASAGIYTVTVTDGEGCERTAQTTVVVNDLPLATLTGALSYCEGSTRSYIAGGGVLYTFYLNGTEVQAQSGVNSYITSSTLAAGTHILRVLVEDAAGCEGEEDIEFIVYPEPVATIAFAPDAVCEGESAVLTITLTTGDTSNWGFEYNYGGAPITRSGLTTANYSETVTPTGDITYTVTSITDGNGCTATPSDLSATLTVNEQPTVGASSNPPTNQVCVDGSITLTASGSGGSGNYVYRWSKGGVVLQEGTQDTYVITGAQLSDACTYSVVVIDTEGGVSCESDPATIDVVVTQATATLTGTDSFCYGTTEVYTAGGGVNYTFTLYQGAVIVAGPVSGAGNTYTTSSTLAAGSYTLMVEVEDANGCIDQETYAFIIYPEPEATIAFDAAVICEGGSSNLIITLTTGTPVWSAVFNNGTVDANTGNVAGTVYTLPVTATSDLTYTLKSVSDANCSATINATATLTVNEQPKVGVTSSNPPTNQVCVDGSITLIASGSGGSGNYVYRWSKGGVVLQEGTQDTYVITGAQLSDAGEYSVVVRDTDNGITCESAPASLTVDVTFATATLIGSTNVCEGTSETYVAGGGLSFSFILYEATSAIIETGPASADNTYSIPNNLAKGHYTLQVIVEDASGCTDDELLTFTVMEAPSNSITYSSTDICDGENITVTATSGYSSYDFTVNGASVQTGTNNVYSSNEWTNGDIVKVAITLGSCAVESAETTITVRDIPTVTLLSDQTDNMACLGEEVVFTAGGADNYTFSVNGTAVQGPGVANTYSSSTLADGDIVLVLGEDAFGCSASASITLGVNTPTATISANDTEICANETLVLTANTGVLYEFFRNGVSLGETTVNPLEITDPADGDVFSVRVVNAHGCEEISPDITIIVHPVPIVNLTSSATEICVGDPITFNAEGGNQYSFYVIRGAVDILLQSGTSDSFVTTELQDGDEVYVDVRDANMCNAISPNIDITVNPLPTAGIIVLPSNYIGEGDNVTVEASGGDEYLYLVNGLPYDGDPNGWTTEASIIISDLVDGDVLTIKARSTFGCEDTSEPVIIETTPYPLPFDLLPLESQYCSDEAGVRLYLSSYEVSGVIYQLYKIDTPDEEVMITPSPGEGMLGWDNVPEGTYRVKATRIPIGLERWSGIVTVTQNQVPNKYNMTPDGTQTSCPVEISLDNSEAGINYYLMLNGSVFAGPLTDEGIPLNFGSYNIAGSYTVYAVNPTSGCSADMNGVLDFDIDPMPVKFVLSSSPTDGQYCEGEEGVRLLLDGSTSGVEYQVYRGTSAVGEPYIGDSEAMTFGPFTEEGTYRVIAAGGGGGCLVSMSGAVEITMNHAPDKFDIVAGNDGHFCPGSEGVEIRITGQEAGVEYQLFFNGDAESPKIIGGDNPALPLSFGKYNEAGEYVVIGASGAGCEAEIGSITINIDDTPEVFTLTGDAGFCEGTNPEFTLYGSEAGVEYELYLDGVPMGITVMGTGAPIVFTGTIEGEYSVWASLTTAHNVCKVEMDGNIIVTEKLLPDVTGVTIEVEAGTGTGCDNGLVISVNNPQAGVRYELYFVDNGTYSYTDNFVVGAEDGAAVAFPNPVIDGGGEYIVQAMLDGCPAFIEPKFEIAIDDVPRRFALIGSGDVCEGEDGADLWLSGSEDNVSYELWARHGVSPVQTVTFPHADFDTGEAFPFNKVVEEGAYYVRAVSGNDASCAVTTYEDLEVRFHKLPDAYQFTGAQVFCGTAEGEGAVLKLNDSEAGVVYSLMRRVEGDFTLFVDSKDGNDGPLEFSEVFTEGIYRVYARDTLTGCTSSMNGAVEVEQRPAPSEALTITANDYCSDGSTSELTVAGHETDVFYHLYSPDASGSLIQTLVGTGGTEDLVFEGLQEGNLYTLYASWEDEACMVALSLDISVSLLDSPEVPVLDPIVENPTCAGEAYVSVINAEDGVVYELINIDLGTRFEIVKGVDEPVLWDYTFLDNNGLLSSFLMVRAFNPETLCAVDLEEAIRVDIKAAPADFLLESNGASITKDVPVVKCSNAPLDISIPVSEDGVLYRLYRHSASGGVDRLATLEGNGAEISFSSVTQWPEGDYYVEATFASSGCVGSVAEFTIQLLYSPHHSVPLVLNYTDGLLVVEEKVLNATYTLYFNGEAHPLAPIQVNVLTDEVAWEVGESGTYYVTAQSPAGCIDESNTITISDVTPPVDEYRLVDQVLEYCSGDAGGIDVVLTGTTAGVYYELVKLDEDDPDNPEVIQIKKGITDGGDVVFNGVEGTHTYSIWVDGSADNFRQGEFEVTENPTPSSFFLSGDGAVNSHEIKLSGSEEGVRYLLLFRNDNFDSEEMRLVGTGSTLNFGTVNKPGHYFVIAFGEGGCEAEMEGMANIYQSELVAVNDTLYLSPDDLVGTLDLAENDQFSFIGGLDDNLRFRIVEPAESGAEASLNELSGMLSYSKLPSFYGEDSLKYRIENLDVPDRVSGIGRVVIMVGNKDFNENQSFLLPNAFSPNGDGINDRFVISSLVKTEESTLEVFNRWGTIVYRSQGKQYDSSWDGTSNVGAMVSIGKELPNGVYFYVFEVVKNIEGEIQKRRYNGFVELRR